LFTYKKIANNNKTFIISKTPAKADIHARKQKQKKKGYILKLTYLILQDKGLPGYILPVSEKQH
jgi:predicted ABC-type ATPase